MKYLHLREKKHGNILPKGGMTVAYDVQDNIVKLAMAKCSKRDQYSRKRGRDISTGRFVDAFVNGNANRFVMMIPLFNMKATDAIVKVVRNH